MATKIEELKKDLEELQTLEKQATRRKVQDFISLEIRKISEEISKLQAEIVSAEKAASAKPVSSHYQIKITNYGWDQTSKFVKFYVTLPKVQTLPAENIVCKFESKSFELTVLDLESKDYGFKINNLFGVIDPTQSNWKVKTDMIIINAAKVNAESWSHVTMLEKHTSDKKNEGIKDFGDDPAMGITQIMQNMYQQGDDELKRTIAKAWHESQNMDRKFN